MARPPRQAGLSDGPGLEQLISAKELASRLKVTERTVRRAAARREIPHVRIGNQLRFDVLAVKKAILQRGDK